MKKLWLTLLLGLALGVQARAGDGVPVRITAPSPIQKLDAAEHPTGVSMAPVGACFTLIHPQGESLVLRDSTGKLYLIALRATDYTPPAAPSPSPAATATAAPTAIPIPAPVAVVAAPVPDATAAAPSAGNPPPADVDKMEAINAALGIPLLADGSFWQEDVTDIARRIGWPRESKTPTQQSFRRYASDQKPVRIFGVPAYSMALYGKNGSPTYISIVFANEGDFSEARGLGPWGAGGDLEKITEDLAHAVKQDAADITAKLTPILGDPTTTTFGNTSSDRDEVHRWDWKDVAILLSAHDGKYASVKIIPTDVADNHGEVAVTDRDQMRDLLAARVVRRPNGDVVVTQVPMVDQGPKGYCVPATWERYLRYMDVPADLYVLAIMGQTGFGGGTNVAAMQAGVDDYVSAYHRRIETYDAPLDVSHVARYIDQGLPLMWACRFVPPIEIQCSHETVERRSVTDWPKYAETLRARDAALGNIQASGAGHMRMIIGYNATTNEIAISDSWGEDFAERWMYAGTAAKISEGNLGYLAW